MYLSCYQLYYGHWEQRKSPRLIPCTWSIKLNLILLNRSHVFALNWIEHIKAVCREFLTHSEAFQEASPAFAVILTDHLNELWTGTWESTWAFSPEKSDNKMVRNSWLCPHFFFLWSIHVWSCKILRFISNSFSAIFLISNVNTKKDFCFKCHYEAFYVCTL